MAKINIGCAGWSYKGWKGPFYPRSMDPKKYLEYYAKYFDFVEVNSTFYKLPSVSTLETWLEQVPKSFKFSVKASQKITHKRGPYSLEDTIRGFFLRMEILEPKIYGYLFQFPPFFKYSKKNLKIINFIIDNSNTTKPLVFEFRDNSWFKPEVISSFRNGRQIILCTTYLEGVEAYYPPDQTKYYIRLIGDRTISKFNDVQRQPGGMVRDLEEHIKILFPSPKIEDISVVYNNHFSGFAPWDANNLKKVLNLPYKEYNTQKSLIDFI
jgi:uncharacterized protein YecE (DUF72 family)